MSLNDLFLEGNKKLQEYKPSCMFTKFRCDSCLHLDVIKHAYGKSVICNIGRFEIDPSATCKDHSKYFII